MSHRRLRLVTFHRTAPCPSMGFFSFILAPPQISWWRRNRIQHRQKMFHRDQCGPVEYGPRIYPIFFFHSISPSQKSLAPQFRPGCKKDERHIRTTLLPLHSPRKIPSLRSNFHLLLVHFGQVRRSFFRFEKICHHGNPARSYLPAKIQKRFSSFR